MVELREVPMIGSQEGTAIENFIDTDWDKHWEN